VSARVLVAAVAIVVLAWLAVGERDLRLERSGVAAAERRDFAAADADLRAARLLNPDTGPDISRAFALQAQEGRYTDAAAVLRDVVRREPDNVFAWRSLAGFARDLDPPTAAHARAVLRRLDPLSARSRR
jgi:Tfp pilus assembly protein PilF